ncbi:MAG: hypothetical protein MI724_01205, partial [Spirochaetales bacterium]|nr:hypothetical protein [Spirochaetales bacterium]
LCTISMKGSVWPERVVLIGDVLGSGPVVCFAYDRSRILMMRASGQRPRCSRSSYLRYAIEVRILR